MPNLHVLFASTRPERMGLPVAQWFVDLAKKHGKFEVRLVDLKEVNLPIFDEPKHPRLKQYAHEHTKAWSKTVEEADAFVVVSPEYDYGAPPAFLNALIYLFHEWAYKPLGIVGYGGASGGSRAGQAIRTAVTSVKIMPVPEMVVVNMFNKHLENGVFKGEAHEPSATGMLDELLKWTGALQTLRAK